MRLQVTVVDAINSHVSADRCTAADTLNTHSSCKHGGVRSSLNGALGLVEENRASVCLATNDQALAVGAHR